MPLQRTAVQPSSQGAGRRLALNPISHTARHWMLDSHPGACHPIRWGRHMLPSRNSLCTHLPRAPRRNSVSSSPTPQLVCAGTPRPPWCGGSHTLSRQVVETLHVTADQHIVFHTAPRGHFVVGYRSVTLAATHRQPLCSRTCWGACGAPPASCHTCPPPRTATQHTYTRQNVLLCSRALRAPLEQRSGCQGEVWLPTGEWRGGWLSCQQHLPQECRGPLVALLLV